MVDERRWSSRDPKDPLHGALRDWHSSFVVFLAVYDFLLACGSIVVSYHWSCMLDRAGRRERVREYRRSCVRRHGESDRGCCTSFAGRK